MDNKVKIVVKSVYGKEVCYPANDLASKFTQLAKSKTLSHYDMAVIESMGFEIVQVLNSTRPLYTVINASKP
jgi:hypothetical protein